MMQNIATFTKLFDFSGLRNKIKLYFATIEQNREIKRTINELNQLSDKELWDIGITRGDIWSVAHEVYYDDRIKTYKTNNNLKGWV